jgi:hypothetical protein
LPHEGLLRKPRLWARFSRYDACYSIRCMRTSWLLVALVFAIAIALLEQWALADFLYWRYPLFDVLMHFLGGLAVGSFLVGLLPRFSPRLYLIGFTLVAISWEILEYMLGVPREANFVSDTAIDMLMDALGAILIYLAARLTIWRSV